MGQQTKISWAHSTWNPWIGCTKFAAECLNCYAEEMDLKRFSRTLGEATPEAPVRHWGKGAPRHLTKTGNAPLAWNRKPLVCSECGFLHTKNVMVCNCGSVEFEHRRVFCGSLMDWADEEVSDSWRDKVFDVAERCTNLTFLFLTKRIKNASRYLYSLYGRTRKIPNHFWIGMSWMKDRPEDVRHLLEIPAAVRFLSVEPMLGPVDFRATVKPWGEDGASASVPSRINWVILGGESGPKARPCNVEWIRDAVRQCRGAGVKVFVKQLGGYCTSNPDEIFTITHPKGADPVEWPQDLRVQEIPGC